MKRFSFIFKFLPLLMCFVLFSVGFASWTAVKPIGESASASAGMIASNVYQCAKVSNIDVFDYTSFHFLDTSNLSDPKPTDVGYINVECEIDIDECKARIAEKGDSWNNTLDITVALFYSGVDDSVKLFDEVDDGSYYRSVTASLVGQSATGVKLANSGSVLNVEAKLTGLANSGKCKFNIKFAINIPENLQGTDTALNFISLFGKHFYKLNGNSSNINFIATTAVKNVE